KQLNVRMPPDELKSLDVWIKTQPAPRPTRAEEIRRLVGQALAGGAQPSQKRSKKSAAKAREMAGQAIDRVLGDAGSLPVDERETRGKARGRYGGFNIRLKRGRRIKITRTAVAAGSHL